MFSNLVFRIFQTNLKYQIIYILLLIFFLIHPFYCFALSVGSDSVPSRQTSTIVFPSTDSNNTILGFVALENGFVLSDNITTCTFNALFPISGEIRLNGGIFSLQKDLELSSMSEIIDGGQILGNYYLMSLPQKTSPLFLPRLDYSPTLSTIAQNSMYAVVTSLDWSNDGNYIASAAVKSVSPDLIIHYFDGSNLTSTISSASSNDFYSVRWSPANNYLAAVAKEDAEPEFYVYNFTPTFGQLIIKDSKEINATVRAVDWHPSGTFLAISTEKKEYELVVYPFNQVTGKLGTQILFDVPGDRKPTNNSLSWAPEGSHIVLGVENLVTVGYPEILVFSFTGTSLSITTSAEVSLNVTAVDWSSTGTFIAAGITGGTNNLKIYEHQSSPESLNMILSIPETQDVVAVDWNPTGDALLVGTSNGISSKVDLYEFDKTTTTLTLVSSIPSGYAVNSVRWAPSGNFFSRGDSGNFVTVSGLVDDQYPLSFFDSTLVMNSDVQIKGNVNLYGTCKIQGNGKKLILGNDGIITIKTNGSTIFEDVVLHKLQHSNLQCEDHSTSITFNNCCLMLSKDYSFSFGSILFDHDVIIEGNNKRFIYGTSLTSTINIYSRLKISDSIIFEYAPSVSQNNLLYQIDKTSVLHCDGCSLVSTKTGITLANGTLLLENKVTLSNDATSESESTYLSPSLDIKLLSGANVELFGIVKAN